MTAQLSAEMILSTGSASAPVETAIGAVKDVLCQPQGTSKDVYAVIIRAKHRSAEQPDHLSMMNAVILAAKRSWHEVAKDAIRRGRAQKLTTIEVVERNGIRIYRGCES